jgi:hypothetical protein
MTRKDLTNMISNQSVINGFVVLSKERDTSGHYTYTLKDAQGVVTSGVSFVKVAKILGGEVATITEGGAKKKVTASSVDTAKILKLDISSPTTLTNKVVDTLISDSKRLEMYLMKVCPDLLDNYQSDISLYIDIIAKKMYDVFCESAYNRKVKAVAYEKAQKEKEAAEAREQRITDLTHRLQVLKDYIVQYDSKIGAAFVSGDTEKAQMLAIQKNARVARANEIISGINILIEE